MQLEYEESICLLMFLYFYDLINFMFSQSFFFAILQPLQAELSLAYKKKYRKQKFQDTVLSVVSRVKSSRTPSIVQILESRTPCQVYVKESEVLRHPIVCKFQCLEFQDTLQKVDPKLKKSLQSIRSRIFKFIGHPVEYSPRI